MDFPAMARARRGITKSGLAPSDAALEGFRAGARQPFVSEGDSDQIRKWIILDVEVSFQRRKLRKSFAASRHFTWVRPAQIVRKCPWGPMRREHSLDAIMQTAVSITVGLARKDLVTYFTNIFGYSRLERVQNRLRTEKKRLTAFMILIGQRRNPVRDAVKNEWS